MKLSDCSSTSNPTCEDRRQNICRVSKAGVPLTRNAATFRKLAFTVRKRLVKPTG
jgi:hypothetical protein